MSRLDTKKFTLYCASPLIIREAFAPSANQALYDFKIDPDLITIEQASGQKVLFRYKPDGKTYVLTDHGYV